MYHTIHIRNFKCFRDEKLRLAPLSLMTGLNGTGKSSVIQSILVFKQSSDAGNNNVHLNGYWTTLGSLSDVLSFFDEKEETISINLMRESSICKFEFSTNSESPPKWSSDNIEFILEPLNSFSYLCADRWGPRVAMPMDDQNALPRHVGKYGEFTVHFLTEHGQSKIPNSLLPSHPNAKSRLLEDEVTAWLGEVSPGARINTQSVPQADFSYSTFAFPAGDQVTRDFRATNVGFGLSYSLPVIVSLVSAKPGGLVIIENPEAHLHPAGQTAIGRLIATVANTGVQVIVETHSDHILDSIRIAVKDSLILSENVAIHYFRRKDNGESEVISPTIRADGKMSAWPRGFFDQSAKNLTRLNSRAGRS